jgi:hypothetical protein
LKEEWVIPLPKSPAKQTEVFLAFAELKAFKSAGLSKKELLSMEESISATL